MQTCTCFCWPPLEGGGWSPIIYRCSVCIITFMDSSKANYALENFDTKLELPWFGTKSQLPTIWNGRFLTRTDNDWSRVQKQRGNWDISFALAVSRRRSSSGKNCRLWFFWRVGTAVEWRLQFEILKRHFKPIWRKDLLLLKRWSFSLCNHDYEQVCVKGLLDSLLLPGSIKLFCLWYQHHNMNVKTFFGWVL